MDVVCWLLLAALFIVVEILTLGLTTIWFAIGSFAAAVASASGVGFVLQIMLFILVSFICLFVTRPIAKKYFNTKTEKTNVEALINQTALVLEEINNIKGTGLAKVNGMEWTARASEDDELIQAGEKVKILSIEGVKLIVRKM